MYITFYYRKMVKLPKLKKDMLGFLVGESGKISKQALMKIGFFLTTGAIGTSLKARNVKGKPITWFPSRLNKLPFVQYSSHTSGMDTFKFEGNIIATHYSSQSSSSHSNHSSHGSHSSHSSHGSHSSHSSHSSHGSHSNHSNHSNGGGGPPNRRIVT
jgi:hypothetical protein